MTYPLISEKDIRILPGSVALFVDFQNIQTSVKKKFGAGENVDWSRLIALASAHAPYRRTLACMRLPKSGTEKQIIERRMQILGFQELVECEGDADQALIERAQEFRIHGCFPESMVLASGDSDFMVVYERNKSRGIQSRVIAVPGTLAITVEQFVDEVILLREEHLWRPRFGIITPAAKAAVDGTE